MTGTRIPPIDAGEFVTRARELANHAWRLDRPRIAECLDDIASDVAAEIERDRDDRRVGLAVKDAIRALGLPHLGVDNVLFGRRIREAVEATINHAEPEAAEATAARDATDQPEEGSHEETPHLERGRWDRTVLAAEPIPDDLVTRFRRAVEQSADDPANVLYKTHVYHAARALRVAIEQRGELVGYSLLKPGGYYTTKEAAEAAATGAFAGRRVTVVHLLRADGVMSDGE